MTKPIIQTILSALASSILFLFIKAAMEFVWANWISSKTPWPDQQSYVWILQESIHLSAIYLIAFLIGGFLSLTYITEITLNQNIIWVIGVSILCSFIIVSVSFMELSENPAISLGVMGVMPLVAVVITALMLRLMVKI